MFEFLFFVTALYMGYVAYEAYAAVNRSEKGEPVMKPTKAQAAPKTAPAKATAAAKVPAEKKAPAKPAAAQKAPAATKATPAPKAVKAAPAPAPKAPAAAPKPVAAKPAPAKPKAAPKAPTAAPQAPVTLAENLKNPETGETTPVPANYRFAKKWIKDALVAEKLLDRVYKPNELDGPASDKVKEAIDKLRALKKYQA